MAQQSALDLAAGENLPLIHEDRKARTLSLNSSGFSIKGRWPQPCIMILDECLMVVFRISAVFRLKGWS